VFVKRASERGKYHPKQLPSSLGLKILGRKREKREKNRKGKLALNLLVVIKEAPSPMNRVHY
jgi:hypothetical protein